MHATHLHSRKAQQLQETTKHIEIYTDIYIFHQLSRCQNVLIVKRKLLKRKPKKKQLCPIWCTVVFIKNELGERNKNSRGKQIKCQQQQQQINRKVFVDSLDTASWENCKHRRTPLTLYPLYTPRPL